MALRLRVKSVDGLRERCDRFVKVTFRGASFGTSIRENENETIIFDELFQWPIGTNVSSHEVLYLQLFNHNKYLSNKLIGSYGIVLQQVIEDNELNITDNFTDDNNMPTNAKISFQVCYCGPESASQLSWSHTEDESQLIDIETQSLYPKSPKKHQASPSRTIPSTMKSIANKMKIHKKVTKTEVEERTSLGRDGLPEYGSTLTVVSNDVLLNMDLSPNYSESFQQIDSVPFSITTPVCVDKLQDREQTPFSLKAQDFQVCVTIIEARHLAGLNMDPVICVQIGDIKKYTSVKESTNCPYYNEYFVFDFHMSAAMLFDKIITLTVLYSRNIIRSGKPIGSFKLDVGTVFSQPDHQFYHKWALLTDPDDIGSGAKGYLKCDLLVAGKGDAIKPPVKNDSNDEDDIEGNLLLPRGVIAERQHAKYIIKIYRADGLPRNKSGIMANVKKAISSDARQLVSPYVQVSFAGLSSKTSVKRNCCSPVWNEQIVITEMFPPLCQRIKIQIRDSDPVSDNVIATHFIQLSKISNEGAKGFLPTFGPSFIYLYGSVRDGSIFDDQSVLNDGFSEGIMYRGRILIAIKTEILESLDANLCGVNVEPTSAINENNYGKPEEFLLFASIFDSNMIDRKYADRPLHYEISFGNDGIREDNNSMTDITNDGSEDKSINNNNSEKQNLLSFVGQQYNYEMRSTIVPIRPVMTDRQYYHLPIESEKPCLYLKSSIPDHRRRAYNSNIIEKIAQTLEIGLFDVQEMIRVEKLHPERRLRGVIEQLIIECSRYLTIMKGCGGSAVGKTKLDKDRLIMCQREIEQIIANAKLFKQNTNENNMKENLKNIYKQLNILKELTKDPQHSLPDIFIWLLCGGKRIAYQKLETRHYFFSLVDEECGKLCGKLHNIFLKLPGKKNDSMNGIIQNMLHIYIWVGNKKHKKHYPKGLPKGYRLIDELQNADKSHLMPPTTISYEEKHRFQLRAHIYQARSLFASDSSGLSDPFAKVILSDSCQTTEVIEETLSPTWDQMLIFPEITLYGERQYLINNPPIIVIEIYDRDKVGKSEFIGRALARDCYIRFSDQTYRTPQLQWFDVWKGDESAGQLLACFELIQLSERTKANTYPEILPEFKSITPAVNTGSILYDNQIGIFPVPESIRPTLSKYRIEVLFWGLRDLKRVQFMSVDRPRVDIECAGNILQSSIILNYKKNPNFMIPVKHIDLELPDQEMYCPPLTIRVMDCRSFGRFVLVGTHMIASLSKYAFKENDGKDLLSTKLQEVIINPKLYGFSLDSSQKISKTSKNLPKKKPYLENGDNGDEEEDNSDWWSRYFASIEAMIQENIADMKSILDEFSSKKLDKEIKQSSNAIISSNKFRKMSNKSLSPKKMNNKSILTQQKIIKIYPNELELCPQFEGFKEYLQSFELYRGKRYGNDSDDQSRLCGIFKGSLKLYRHPFSAAIFESRFLPSNEPINVLIRIYVVRGSDLHPADLNGKADPYIVINLGSKRISDKENYISKQLNPIFGKCFEFDATFPQDSLCTLQIYDWDLFGTDDLIGETKIDLENRFYSRHRATCGLSKTYETVGPNQWRDSLKPTQILAKLCKDYKLSGPLISTQKIKVGLTTFRFGDPTSDILTQPSLMSDEEMALAVLHNWSHITGELVPEHIETRSLYHPDKPGIEQGKLEMWVDMFPKDAPPPPPSIDISPRKPKSYELRVIIWNTEDVLLEDDAFFTGEKMSDIYVKGWLKGPEDTQCTDIHYRSLTGEGNFNWRFVFPFDYLPAEEKIVISRKESLFSWDETECKIPARLFLQVWDADHFSADDFLGAITLDLNHFPRGAKTAKLCSLDMLKSDKSAPTVSLFKQKRIKGWWPFYGKKDNKDSDEMELTGKVEAELQLLTKEEAERNPVGFGRGEPDPLEKPNRPDSSFLWVLNPLKSIRYIVWHNYKWLIIKGILFLLLVLLLALFVYSIPGYTVKKMIGA